MTADEFLTEAPGAGQPSADEFLKGGMSADEFLSQEDPPTIGAPREVGFFRGIYDAARNTKVADTILGPPEYRRPPLGDRIQQEGLIGAAMAPFAGAIPRIGRQESLPAQVGAGSVNALSALTEGLVSPLAATSLLPSTLGRVASAGFAVDMGRHVPGQVMASVDAFRGGDVQGGVESGVGALGSLGFAGLAAKHAITPESPVIVGTRYEPGEMAVSLSEALRQSVEQSSLPPGLATDALVMRTPGEPVLRPAALEGPTNLEVELQRGPIPDDPPVRVAESDVVSPPVRPPQPDTPRQMPAIDAESAGNTLDPVTGQRPAETITGSNEGIASEMPAEREERPQPAAGDPVNPAPIDAPARVVRSRDPNAPTTLVEFLKGNRIINLAGIRAAAPDWAPPASLRKNFRANSGTSWDVVAREMFETGLLKTEPKDAGEFAEAITRANETAKSYRQENALQRRTVDVEAKQLSQFETKVLDGKVSKASGPVEPLALSDIYKGDTFQADGHKFEVKETRTDEDGNLLSVRLKDGPKFGEQVVDAERGQIFVEPGSLKQKPRADDFLSAEDVANDPFADPVAPPAGTEDSSVPATPTASPPVMAEAMAQIPELPAHVAHYIAKSMAPDVIREHTAHRFGNSEAERAPSSKPTPEQQAIVDEAKAFAASKGWPWDAVVEKARTQLGLDQDFLAPGSREAELRDQLRIDKAALAERVAKAQRLGEQQAAGIFDGPESVAEQTARMEREAAEAAKRKQREDMLERAGRKLTGKAIDTTGDLLDPMAADNPLFAVPMGRPGGGRGGSKASIGEYAEGGPVTLGHIETLRPVQSPELVRLAQALGSDVLARKLAKARGLFYPMGNGTIKLNRQLFELGYEQQLAKTLAHEIGHLVDWLPDKAMDRGNILGRIATLRDFLRHSMPRNPYQSMDTVLTPKDRHHLRRKAESIVGPKPPKDETADRAAWSAEVSRVYQEQVRAEMAARGLVKAGDVHAELWELSKDWRPLGKEVTDSHLAYRMGSDELYADAISVLLNNPGMLETRAPKFYKLFFDYLDRKPAVREAYFSLQELLSQGPLAVAQRRRSQTVEGFIKGEEILREKLRQDRDAESQPHGWWARVQQEWVDRGSYLKQQVERIKAKGEKISPDVDPTIAVEEMGWVESEHAVTAQDVHQRVVGPVIAAGLDTHSLGELLKYERIAGGLAARQRLRDRLGELGREEYDAYRGYARNVTLDRETAEAVGIDYDLVEAMRTDLAEQGTRADIPNPAAESPDSVQASLDSLRRSMTEQQWQTLRKAGAEFRKIVYEKMKRATEEGIISRSTFDHTITDNKDWYATFRGLDHIEDTVSPFIRQAKGSLSDIENPFYSTVLKLFSVNNVMLRNRAKRLTRDQFIQHFPDEFRPAESYHNGKQRMLRNPKDGLVRLELMEDGKKLSYDVDPYIGAAFEKMTPADVGIFTKTLNGMFGAIYPLIIKYNPQFQLLTNPVRDFSRTVRSYRALTGEGGMVSMARRYADAIKSAKNFVSGDLSDPVVRAMMEAKAIGTPMEGFGQNAGETAGWGEILERYRILRPAEKTQLRRAAGYLPHAIQRAGAVLEALPKVAAFKALTIDKGLSPREAAATVRRYIGTPDYKLKGTHGAVHNSLVPFLNIFLQGYRADLRLATQPKTAGGWWMRYMLQDGSIAMMTGLAVAGAFGSVIQQAFEGISEHDRSNYIVIPVGFEAAGEHGRKVIYARLPRDEASRVVSAAVYKLSKLAADAAAGNPVSPGRVAGDVFGAVEAIIPSVNPILDIAGAWSDYLRNSPPIDAWRNRPIIPDREWNAGGWAAVKPLLKWTAGKTGIFNIFAYDTEAETTTEMAVSGVPVLKTLLKISDYGYTEKQSQFLRDRTTGRAQLRVGYADEVVSLAQEHEHLEKLGRQRSPEQARRYAPLHRWYLDYRKMDEDAVQAREAGRPEQAERLVNRQNSIGKAVKDRLTERRQKPLELRPIYQP